MCLFRSAFLAWLIVLSVFRPARAEPRWSGTPEIEQALARLNVLGSVLMIAAHPDDENNLLLAWFARGRHYRTAYLSATRGEGGQNLIGPELGVELGLIRTQELLAARRIDGALQFFTRAVDFGFSKSAEETLATWGRERILSDIVWVIRHYRPDVITMTFSGTPRDGHGHHQASGMLAREAFAAAADPTRFPEQLSRVQPWRARRLVHHPYFQQPGPGAIRVDGGQFNPVLGHSYAEIAGMSRSMHRSQAMGSAQPKGPAQRHFVVVAGEPAARDIFEGIDTTWGRVPGGAEAGRILAAAARGFDPHNPAATIPALLEARAAVAALRHPWAEIKLAEIDNAVALCAGLWLDVQADRWDITPGSQLPVRLTALNRSGFPLTLAAVELEGLGPRTTENANAPLPNNQPFTREIQRPVPADQPYSQPYWLLRPHRGGAYEVADPQLIGLPENPPVLTARFLIRAGGQELRITRPARFRYIDPVYGERYRPVVVVPPVTVDLPQDVLVFPTAGRRALPVEAAAAGAQTEGAARVETSAGWSASPATLPFRGAPGERQSLAFEITPPAHPGQGKARVSAEAAGTTVNLGMRVIDYPHIPPQVWFPPAEARLVRADIRLTARKIGYIMGAGDEMPAALRQLGAEVALLTRQDLQQGDLAAFDAIVTGVRAYNVRSDLRAAQPRLLEYVRRGGTLVVQYNVLDRSLAGVNLGPYPITLGRGRVSVEDAPVRITDPASPLLAAPNPIAAADFNGWVQERGLYFASQWDPRYHTVLESHDPGEKPLAGGLLWTRYGKGVYIFTAYSWFRQLPAGVPGAYRLFANLLSAR